jgi:predicted nuclease of predicted toxin-antitoxin system
VACRPGRSAAVKLLLDEMFSPVIAARLRERGHDVESIKGSARETLGDAEVLELARNERRAIATNNLVDFRL